MMATNNILSPANGEPIINPTQDVALGLCYMSRERIDAKANRHDFSDVDEVQRALNNKVVDIQAKVTVRFE
jgi:DNA-directed RNA polymerase subunit beta'